MKKLKSTLAFTIMIAFASCQQIADNQMQKIQNQVAEDAVKQYNIAKNSGTAIDAYVSAGLVSAAYLQAKDEPNYKKWKLIEQEEAKNAGMPVQ